MDALNNIFFLLGEYSHLILIIASLIIFFNKKTLYYYYIFGLIVNNILNMYLKLLIREPRPQPLKNTNTTHAYQYLTHFNNYGMPSGHAQNAFFSTLYVWLACKNIKLTLGYVFITLITLYQRVQYNMHTVSQVAVGSIIGTLMGALSFMFFKKKIVGPLHFKPDDNFTISSIGSNL